MILSRFWVKQQVWRCDVISHLSTTHIHHKRIHSVCLSFPCRKHVRSDYVRLSAQLLHMLVNPYLSLTGALRAPPIRAQITSNPVKVLLWSAMTALDVGLTMSLWFSQQA